MAPSINYGKKSYLENISRTCYFIETQYHKFDQHKIKTITQDERQGQLGIN